MSRYQFIDQYRRCYPVRRLCQMLSVILSRYYAWQQRQWVIVPFSSSVGNSPGPDVCDAQKALRYL